MRRFVTLLLVAAIAYVAGVAGTNGTLARLLADAHVAGLPIPVPTSTSPTASIAGAAPTAAQAGAAPSAAPTGAVDAARATPTPQATPTTAPSPSPAPTHPPTPPAALSLAQQGPDGTALKAGAWTGAAGATLQVMAPPRPANLSAEVEVRPLDAAFNGTPTGAASVVRGVASVALHDLASGRYHWRARLVSSGGNGRWTAYRHGEIAFRVQREAPPAPQVSSPTDPHPGTTYGTATVAFYWTAPPDPAGIAGFSYRLDTDPRGTARPAVRTLAQQATLGGLGSGTYYFHVRALDGAGNWGPGSTFPVRIDVTPPQVTQATFSAYHFNPALDALRLTYKLNKVSHVTVGIYNAANVRVRHFVFTQLAPAGVPLTVTWDGRDNAGQIVPPGLYSVYLRATDRLGNSNVAGWNGFEVSAKRILVSLSKQQLWAYEGNKVVLTTLVTTGNQALPTPTGLFHIMFARHPFTFHSPWPKGSKFWYKDSTANYALYFHDYGYYIHDAPWRSNFGPGSNAGVGTPGQNYTGTHGCINVPEAVMAQLYTWAVPGTEVQIVP